MSARSFGRREAVKALSRSPGAVPHPPKGARMLRSKIRLLLGPALVPVLVTAFLFAGQSQPASPASQIKNKIIQRELSYELGKAKRPKWAQKVSSGVMYNVLLSSGLLGRTPPGAKPVGGI